MTALSTVGVRQLATAEQTIEQGLGTFMEVGKALSLIQDGRLYRENFDTFEAYCAGRWGFTDRRARQMIAAAEIGTVVPVTNEAQARALASVKDDTAAMQAAYAEAEAEGDVTAAGLARAVAAQKPPANVDENGEVAPKPAEEVVPAEVVSRPSPPTSSVPPVDPTLGYRARATAERSNTRTVLLTLDPTRVIETSDDPKAWADFSHDLRAWLDTLDAALTGPRLKAVQ